MKRLLVCVDGSNYAQPCCQYAAWMAKKMEGKIEVIYVSNMWDFELPFIMDLGASLGVTPYQGVTGQLEELENTKAQMIEEAVRDNFKKMGVEDNISFNHRTGSLVDYLTEFIDVDDADDSVDLIILGKRGEDAASAKGHLGATVERVVRASTKPCLVTNREFQQIKKAVVAFDNSEVGQKGLHWACASEKFSDVELHIISVGHGHGAGSAAEAIQNAKSIAKSYERSATYQVLSGNVEDEIANYVESSKADLLMMGAYGHSRIRELLIGSTTTDLLRRCQIPVLLFR